MCRSISLSLSFSVHREREISRQRKKEATKKRDSMRTQDVWAGDSMQIKTKKNQSFIVPNELNIVITIVRIRYTPTTSNTTNFCPPYLFVCSYVGVDLVAVGWPRLVGSLKRLVSFEECRLFYRALLQKRPSMLKPVSPETQAMNGHIQNYQEWSRFNRNYQNRRTSIFWLVVLSTKIN